MGGQEALKLIEPRLTPEHIAATHVMMTILMGEGPTEEQVDHTARLTLVALEFGHDSEEHQAARAVLTPAEDKKD